MSLLNATKQYLKFYKDESENKMKSMTAYFLEKEKFEKIKTAFDNKSDNAKTQQDVDSFNNSVNALNKASADYNKINNELNSTRFQNNENWNKTAQSFLDRHVPKNKK
jgi:uncharacterized protein YpuA (DUF1002 family)